MKGEGPRENVGQKARMNFATWGTFCAKFAPVGALFPQYVPHSLHKMFPSWGIFNVKCAPPGALLFNLMRQAWPGGGAKAPLAPPLYPPLVDEWTPLCDYLYFIDFIVYV